MLLLAADSDNVNSTASPSADRASDALTDGVAGASFLTTTPKKLSVLADPSLPIRSST